MFCLIENLLRHLEYYSKLQLLGQSILFTPGESPVC